VKLGEVTNSRHQDYTEIQTLAHWIEAVSSIQRLSRENCLTVLPRLGIKNFVDL